MYLPMCSSLVDNLLRDISSFNSTPSSQVLFLFFSFDYIELSTSQIDFDALYFEIRLDQPNKQATKMLIFSFYFNYDFDIVCYGKNHFFKVIEILE